MDRWGNTPLADAINYEHRTGDARPVTLLRAVDNKPLALPPSPESTSRLNAYQQRLSQTQAAMISAAEGDVMTLKQLLDNGIDVNCSDYDRRTPLAVRQKNSRIQLLQNRPRERMLTVISPNLDLSLSESLEITDSRFRRSAKCCRAPHCIRSRYRYARSMGFHCVP